MAGMQLEGSLNLMGDLTLNASGGKVTVGGVEALVQVDPRTKPNQGTAPPVILPPPPASPLDEMTNVWVVNSFNQRVTIGTAPVVALGMVMEGGKSGQPTWPGMMLPSMGNTGPVTVNGVLANVLGDQAVIFLTGAPATLNANSGQGT